MKNKIHEVPLSQDLETISDTEAEELALEDETARLSRPYTEDDLDYELTAEELTDLERPCLLYTSDAADEEDSVDLGGRRIIKKKKYGINN